MKINQEKIQEKWYLVDATGKRIGQIATKVAELLLGKNDVLVKTHVVPQNKVVVINAEKVDFTPKRGFTKFYKRYSGYPSGLKVEDLDTLIKRRPTEPLNKAIKGMIPKNKRGKQILENLFVYEGNNNPHESQKPVVINLDKIKF